MIELAKAYGQTIKDVSDVKQPVTGSFAEQSRPNLTVRQAWQWTTRPSVEDCFYNEAAFEGAMFHECLRVAVPNNVLCKATTKQIHLLQARNDKAAVKVMNLIKAGGLEDDESEEEHVDSTEETKADSDEETEEETGKVHRVHVVPIHPKVREVYKDCAIKWRQALSPETMEQVCEYPACTAVTKVLDVSL